MAAHARTPDINPYAPSAVVDPRQDVAGFGVGVWRDGRRLVMHRDAVLPDVCLKTGQPATRRFSQKVKYRERWFATLTSATIEVPLSQKWHFLVRFGWWLLATGVVALYARVNQAFTTQDLRSKRVPPPQTRVASAFTSCP